MNGEKILSAIGLIDDRYIEEAEQGSPKKPKSSLAINIKRIGLIAASLLLLLIGGLAVKDLLPGNDNLIESEPVIASDAHAALAGPDENEGKEFFEAAKQYIQNKKNENNIADQIDIDSGEISMTKTLPDDIKMTGNDYDKEGDIICISYKYSGDQMDYYDIYIDSLGVVIGEAFH